MRHGEVVVAVVPLYNPSARLQDVVARLVRQCAHVVLVDDGSDEKSWAKSARLASERVSVIRGRCNSGIAKALNDGVHYALKNWDVDFILTCDQDSFMSDLYVASAIHRLRQAKNSEIYGLVAASAFNGQRVQTRIGRRLDPLEPMQSGMLIRAAAFERVGYFGEDLFIDCVDTDFYLRCRSQGLKTLCAPPGPFEHHLGGARGQSVMASRHSRHPPWRTYYVVRNRLKTLRIYGARDPEWAVRIFAIQVTGLLLTLASSPDRKAQWAAIRMGYHAFRSGASGPMSNSVRDALLRHQDRYELPTRQRGRI